MSSYGGFDRRLPQFADDTETVVVCRVCWAHVPLADGEHLEMADGRPFFRCPECGGSFLVRDEDTHAGRDGTTG